VNKINETLAEEITSLIDKKQEGGYWDFKLDWHDNKASLLHDIMCLANNIENRDAYLIFGVKDKTYEICGVSEDNRLNTVNVVNFLRNKKFVGNVRPTVRVETITVEGKELDILIIENSHYTPFRLSQDFKYESKKSDGKDIVKTVKAHNVYTRIQDTNTPIDKTADPDKEEKLWRKRFHIDEPVHIKAMYYLESPKDWESSETDWSDSYIVTDEQEDLNLKLYRPVWNNRYYYRYAPEYSINFTSYCSDISNEHFLCLLFPDSSGTVMDVIVKVNNQIVYNHFYVNLDGTRAKLIRPRSDAIILNDNPFGRTFTMSYIVKGSFDYMVNEFLIKSQNSNDIGHCIRRWKKYVIQFESEYEKSKFEEHIMSEYDDALYDQEIGNIEDIVPENKLRDLDVNHNKLYKDAKVLMREYHMWRVGF
jgi:putative abi-alpha protein